MSHFGDFFPGIESALGDEVATSELKLFDGIIQRPEAHGTHGTSRIMQQLRGFSLKKMGNSPMWRLLSCDTKIQCVTIMWITLLELSWEKPPMMEFHYPTYPYRHPVIPPKKVFFGGSSHTFSGGMTRCLGYGKNMVSLSGTSDARTSNLQPHSLKIGPNCTKRTRESIPTIHFQGQAVSFREGISYSLKHLDVASTIGSVSFSLQCGLLDYILKTTIFARNIPQRKTTYTCMISKKTWKQHANSLGMPVSDP